MNRSPDQAADDGDWVRQVFNQAGEAFRADLARQLGKPPDELTLDDLRPFLKQAITVKVGSETLEIPPILP